MRYGWRNSLQKAFSASAVWVTFYHKERYTSKIAGLVLIPYFLFYTGFIYVFSDVSQTSVALATDRLQNIFTQREDISAAKWLEEVDHVAKVKSDDHAAHILSSYVAFPANRRLSFTVQNLETNDTALIFLSSGNIANDKIWVINQTELGDIAQPVSLGNSTFFEPLPTYYMITVLIFTLACGTQKIEIVNGLSRRH